MGIKPGSLKSFAVSRTRAEFEYELSRHSSYISSAITETFRLNLVAEAFDDFIAGHGKSHAAVFAALLGERLERRGDSVGAAAVKKFPWRQVAMREKANTGDRPR